ncbi:hypothetical protein DY000_02048353 [Brassica cretica]|uniref:Uncharacterized protein n=1 Tax=Brassica cretica TaxID=69181 RepID=A0ABQ7F0B4_BRACR|nr:hypothetical protein DY000_02048353 [Brassica cretica]
MVLKKMMCSISRSFGSYGLKSYTETSRPRTSRYEEYIDYLYPKESQTTNLKILEAAYKWKKQKLAASEEDYDYYQVSFELYQNSAAVYKVYSIAARMLADFQENVGLTNYIWEKETAKTPKMQIYGRKERFLFIFFFTGKINFYDADEWFLSRRVEEEIVNLQVGSQEVDTEQWRGPRRDGLCVMWPMSSQKREVHGGCGMDS